MGRIHNPYGRIEPYSPQIFGYSFTQVQVDIFKLGNGQFDIHRQRLTGAYQQVPGFAGIGEIAAAHFILVQEPAGVLNGHTNAHEPLTGPGQVDILPGVQGFENGLTYSYIFQPRVLSVDGEQYAASSLLSDQGVKL